MNQKFKRFLWALLLSLLATLVMWHLFVNLKIAEVMAAIVILEGGKEKVITLSRKNLFFISKLRTPVEHLYEKMQSLGWQYVAQFGRGMVFSRDGEEVVLMKQIILNRYAVYVLKSAFRNQDEIKGF